MSNVAVTLVVPSANGVGAAVDVSGLGVDKTVILSGTIEAIVIVEASVDGGTTFCQVAAFGFTEIGEKRISIAAEFVRARVQGYKRGSGVMTMGGQNAANNAYVDLDVPAANGVGASVDVSAFGNFWTVIVGQAGRFQGSIFVEISQNGTSFAQALPSFNGEGCASGVVSASFARVRRTGFVALEPGPLTLSIGSGVGTIGGGTDGGTTLDGAYDFGGPGAGRTITADAGAVELQLNALEVSIDTALTISNATPATDPVPIQASPTLALTGQAWDPTPGVTREVSSHLRVLPSTSGGDVYSSLQFMFETPSVSPTEVARIDSGFNGGDGQLLLVNGSTGAPSYSFIDDPDTGMFLNGPGELQFAVGGSQALLIPSTREIQAFQLGTAADPTFSFVNDDDTGLYRAASNRLGVAVAGTNIATFGALTDGVTFARQAYTTPFALTDGANIAVDASRSNVFTVTLAGNRTLDNPTNLVAGMTFMLFVTQDGTGSRTLAFGANYDFGDEGAPTLSTAAGSIDVLSFVALSSTHLACTTLKGF